jgi:predicted metal-binding protein
MMRKFGYQLICVFLLAFLLLSGGCKVNRGKPAIKREKMVEILTDIHLTQAVLSQDPRLPKGAKREYYYCNIFERHGVTEELFDLAIGWYAANLDIFEQVYVEVLARLERKKKELEDVK